ncbi:GNAT family N-acetyltransferase [Methyloligella solikamskensis]|uniref:GNAT family N-acetyltransferase n=1 Tax=Methyloligella solikamskensis TaxID=1177756 RepID=A0ABW3J992_9HYPH
MPNNEFIITPEQAADTPALSKLSANAFGPGRFARTAYRIREGVAPVAELCLTGRRDDELIAGIRFTAISIGGESGALLLGPLVVDPRFSGKGYGKALVQEGLSKAKAAGHRLVILVGDLPYYGRFGFQQVPVGQIVLPGPVDPHRLLACELAEGALASANGLVLGEPAEGAALEACV